MVKYMLAVLMDGIKDADMLMDYAREAKDHGKEECYTWFKSHAKTRTDAVNTDYAYISQKIGLADKIKEGDEMADALASHLSYEIQNLARKFSAMP